MFFLIVASAVVLVMNQFGMFDAGMGQVEVVDGDSLRLKGENIRLQGIDAPEYTQSCRDASMQTYACGKEARRALAALVRGRDVACRSMETDRYGRALSTCKVGGVDVAREMVAQGWAVSYRSLQYISVETQARKARLGLWAGPFEMPAEYRARERLTRGELGSVTSGGSVEAGE